MKPFDPSKPVQTRDGRKARILCTDRAGNCPIVALVTSPANSQEHVFFFNKEGHFDNFQSPTDLVNIPERRVEFRVLYSGGKAPYVGQLKFLSLQDVAKYLSSGARHIAFLEFVYEDDELVDVKLHPRQGE